MHNTNFLLYILYTYKEKDERFQQYKNEETKDTDTHKKIAKFFVLKILIQEEEYRQRKEKDRKQEKGR